MFRINSESLSLWQIFKRVQAIADREVELYVAGTSPLLENLLAFKILERESNRIGKSIFFNFEDPNYVFLLEFLPNKFSLKENFLATKEPKSENVGSVDPSQKEPSLRPLGLQSQIFSRFGTVKTRIWILISLLALAFFCVLGVYFVPQSRVVLTVESEPLVKSIEIVAKGNSALVSLTPPTIPAFEISSISQKSESSPSSGKKEVGEKASGSVTIFNKTTVAVSFSSGTVISKGRTDGEDLRFLTKTATSIPARVADSTVTSGYLPGTVTIDVIAEEIGDEYNLPGTTTFTVGGKSTNDFIAESTSNFSGGSKKQVVVVTAEDQKNLLEVLSESLKQTIRDDISRKLVSGQMTDEKSIKYEVVSKSFDKAVGDEFERFSLTLEVKGTVLAFNQGELKSLVATLLKNYVPDGYELFGSEQEAEVFETRPESNNLIISVKGKGFIVPQINQDQIKAKILGRSRTYVTTYLSDLPNVSSYQIENFPNLGSLSFMPLRSEALKVEVERK